MNWQNIILLILQNISDDDNCINCGKLSGKFRFGRWIIRSSTLHVRNENYYEITSAIFFENFHAHFRMKCK